MPILHLLVLEAASQPAKLALMGRHSSHIDEAYPVTTTHVFVQEAKQQQYNARRLVGERAPHCGYRCARCACLLSDLPSWREGRGEEGDDGEADR